jgi:ABC-type uncharacterized transport system ATPase subunit
MHELLRVENISRRFGGLLALDRASLVAEDGQIVAHPLLLRVHALTSALRIWPR